MLGAQLEVALAIFAALLALGGSAFGGRFPIIVLLISLDLGGDRVGLKNGLSRQGVGTLKVPVDLSQVHADPVAFPNEGLMLFRLLNARAGAVRAVDRGEAERGRQRIDEAYGEEQHAGRRLGPVAVAKGAKNKEWQQRFKRVRCGAGRAEQLRFELRLTQTVAKAPIHGRGHKQQNCRGDYPHEPKNMPHFMHPRCVRPRGALLLRIPAKI